MKVQLLAGSLGLVLLATAQPTQKPPSRNDLLIELNPVKGQSHKLYVNVVPQLGDTSAPKLNCSSRGPKSRFLIIADIEPSNSHLEGSYQDRQHYSSGFQYQWRSVPAL